jgi:hypothetical protein
MKKLNTKVLLGIAVAAAGVASSYGQGSVWLDNYSAAGSPRINYLSVAGKTDGAGVDDPTYKAALYFVLGTVSDSAGNGDLLGSLAAAVPLTTFQAGLGAGYLSAVIDSIPGYTTGPITFEVVGFSGADYASSVGLGAARGHSAAFTLASIATGTTLPGFLDGLQSFNVIGIIPEPSTFALIGLGTGALLFFRRRK